MLFTAYDAPSDFFTNLTAQLAATGVRSLPHATGQLSSELRLIADTVHTYARTKAETDRTACDVALEILEHISPDALGITQSFEDLIDKRWDIVRLTRTRDRRAVDILIGPRAAMAILARPPRFPTAAAIGSYCANRLLA